MSSVTRSTTYTNKTIIDHTVHNTEHDNMVTGINDNDSRITDLESNAVTIAGNKTYSGTAQFNGAATFAAAPTLSADPSTGSQATRKSWTDTTYVAVAGDTMTGLLTLSGAPTSGTHAATKTYVDSMNGVATGYISAAPPVYASASTITVAHIEKVKNEADDNNIAKTTSTTVDISNAAVINGTMKSSLALGDTLVSVSSGSATVTKVSGEDLTTWFQAGDVIEIVDTGEHRRLSSVSGSSATAESNFSSTDASSTIKRGGEAISTFYYLYAVGDGTTNGLQLSTRNVAAGDTLVDVIHNDTTKTGTVSTTATSAAITGSGTAFDTEYAVNDIIVVSGGDTLQIKTITDATNMTAYTNAASTVSGAAHSLRTAYSHTRQLHFAIRNNASGDIIPFYVGPGWPHQPVIFYNVDTTHYNGSNQDGTTQVLSAGTATSPTDVDLSTYMPPISRTAYLGVHLNQTNTSVAINEKSGPASVGKVYGSNSNTTSSNLYQSHYDYMRTDTSQVVTYDKISGTNIYIDLMGYIVDNV